MNICVFCSANSNIDSDFFALTRELGEWMGANGHTLVYGGTDLGLMRCVAEAVKGAGGRVIGVLPARIERGGHSSAIDDERIACHTLAERKALMLDRSDVVVALPGGIGTLDEVFSVAAEGTLAYHAKRVIVYSMKGFWDGLEALLEHLQQQGLIRGDYRERIVFVHTLEEIKREIEREHQRP